MTRTILVNEIDRVLAESRAVMFALREGYPDVQVLKMVQVEGAWEVHADCNGLKGLIRVPVLSSFAAMVPLVSENGYGPAGTPR